MAASVLGAKVIPAAGMDWRRLAGTAGETKSEMASGVAVGLPGWGEAVTVGGGVYPSGRNGVRVGGKPSDSVIGEACERGEFDCEPPHRLPQAERKIASKHRLKTGFIEAKVPFPPG